MSIPRLQPYQTDTDTVVRSVDMVGRTSKSLSIALGNISLDTNVTTWKALGSMVVAFIYHLAPPSHAKKDDEDISPQNTR